MGLGIKGLAMRFGCGNLGLGIKVQGQTLNPKPV